MIQLSRDLQFFFKVRQAPVAKGIQAVIVFQQIFHQVTGFEAGIVDQIPMGNGQVPFSQIDGQVAHVVFSQQCLYIVNKFDKGVGIHCQREGTLHILHGIAPFSPDTVCSIFCKQAVVIIVDIQEIHITVMYFQIFEKITNPALFFLDGQEKGRRSESNSRAYVLNSPEGLIIKIEKTLPVIPCKLIHRFVRLVPYTERPGPYLILSVPADQMLCKCRYQVDPFFQTLGRGGIIMIIIHQTGRVFRQGNRHKRKLAKRAQIDTQHKINHFIDKCEGVMGDSVGIL